MPELQFDSGVRYQCINCGWSCEAGWNIWVEPEVAASVKELPMTLRVIEQRGRAFESQDGALKIATDKDNPVCGFMTDEKLCGIHSELGYSAKPMGCQQFPYLLTSLPDGNMRVTTSYCCSGTLQQAGPELSASLETVRDLLAKKPIVKSVVRRIDILEGSSAGHRDWLEVVEFEAQVEALAGRSGWDAALQAAMVSLAGPLPLGQSPSGGLSRQLPLFSNIMSMSLLKPCLNDTDRDLWRRMDQGFLGACSLEIPEFGWNAPVEELDLWLNQGVGTRFDAEFERYRASLWFRKAHLLVGGLLPGVLMLWSMPALLRLLTGLYAWKRQSEPALEDAWAALRQAELSLLAHSANGSLVYKQMSQHLMALAQLD